MSTPESTQTHLPWAIPMPESTLSPSRGHWIWPLNFYISIHPLVIFCFFFFYREKLLNPIRYSKTYQNRENSFLKSYLLTSTISCYRIRESQIYAWYLDRRCLKHLFLTKRAWRKESSRYVGERRWNITHVRSQHDVRPWCHSLWSPHILVNCL